MFPIATLVTPNIPEAIAILKLMDETSEVTVTCVKEMEIAAKSIYELGSAYVLIKGGHLAPTNTTGEYMIFIKIIIIFSFLFLLLSRSLRLHDLHLHLLFYFYFYFYLTFTFTFVLF